MLHIVHLLERRAGHRAPWIAAALVLASILAMAAGIALAIR